MCLRSGIASESKAQLSEPANDGSRLTVNKAAAMGEVETQPEKLDTYDKVLFIASMVALIVGMWLWTMRFIVPLRLIYEQMGMTEFPAVTGWTLTIASFHSTILPLLSVALVVIGVVAYKRASPKTLKRLTTINWIVVALMPGYIYFIVQSPLIELQRKLGGR